MVSMAFAINRVLAPHKPTAEKLTSYECGEETVGSAWLPFNSRFYVIALIFLLFDVEMVFIFPWATVFGSHDINNFEPRWGWLALSEMFIFLGILVLGLAYVWIKGDLDWIKPTPVTPATDVTIPKSLYENLNLQQEDYQVRPFTLESPENLPLETAVTQSGESSAEKAPVRKPMFKPVFKKPGNEQ